MKKSIITVTAMAAVAVLSFCMAAVICWGYMFIGVAAIAYACTLITEDTPKESRPKAPNNSERKYNVISKKNYK
jgi:hypothetical protein